MEPRSPNNDESKNPVGIVAVVLALLACCALPLLVASGVLSLGFIGVYWPVAAAVLATVAVAGIIWYAVRTRSRRRG